MESRGTSPDVGRKCLPKYHCQPNHLFKPLGLAQSGTQKPRWWVVPFPRGGTWRDSELGGSGSLGPCLGTSTGQGVCLCSLSNHNRSQRACGLESSMVKPERVCYLAPESVLVSVLVLKIASFIFSRKNHSGKSGRRLYLEQFVTAYREPCM